MPLASPPALPHPSHTSPQPRFRDLREQLRLGLWDDASAMALAQDTPFELQCACPKASAGPTADISQPQGRWRGVEHHHTSEPLPVLFAKLEQEEEAEHADLPPWTPPGIEALDMRRGADGEWDLDEDEA